MPTRTTKYLWDIQEAAAAVTQFTEGRSLEDFLGDRMLRSAVEREMITVGEAIAALDRHAPEIAAQITEHDQVIGFRNVLVHGYDDVDYENVWSIITSKLPILVEEVRGLLESSTTQ